MIELPEIIAFDWDDGNRLKSRKHGVLQSEAEEVFFNQPLLLVDLGHSEREPRYHALGETRSGRRLHITYTLRRNCSLIRVISARDMHRKERAFYDQAD
ncbi:MAG: BrnT family toxin [Steroidobacteraceae bacterium]